MRRTVFSFLAIFVLCAIGHAQVQVQYDVQDANGQSLGTFTHSEPDGTGTFVDNNGNASFNGKRTSPVGVMPVTFLDPATGIILIITEGPGGLVWEAFFPNGLYATGPLHVLG